MRKNGSNVVGSARALLAVCILIGVASLACASPQLKPHVKPRPIHSSSEHTKRQPLRRKTNSAQQAASSVVEVSSGSSQQQNFQLKQGLPRWEEVLKFADSVQQGVSYHAGRVPEAFVSCVEMARWHITQGLAHANHHTAKAMTGLKTAHANSKHRFRRGGGGREQRGGSLHGAALLDFERHNNAALQHVLDVIDSPGWEQVAEKHGITVLRKHMHPKKHDGADEIDAAVVDEAAAAKFACVMARGTLAARADDLFALFQSNDRVHEYNDNCADVRDLEVVSQHSKITWARSPRFGPFKARDFVTVVSYTTLADGTLAVVNRPVNHPAAPATKDYVRAEILIATNMMRANAHDPRKTDFVTVAHVNPGGVADSALGANIVNMLCAQAPLKLLQALERAANGAAATA